MGNLTENLIWLAWQRYEPSDWLSTETDVTQKRNIDDNSNNNDNNNNSNNNDNNNSNNISICIAPFARGYKALLPIITVSGKSSQSFRFT